MRFTFAIAAGLFAVAFAQSDSVTPTAAPTTVEAPSVTIGMTPEQSSTLACLDNCAEGDVNCQALCVPVPNPSVEDVSSNDACISACPMGNGTEADIANYGSCVNGCIASFYYTATAPGGPAGSATKSADGSDATGTSGSGSNSDSDGTATGTAGGSEATGNGDGDSAAGMVVPSAVFGLAAFLAAFAL